MKSEKLLEAMGKIDDELVCGAAERPARRTNLVRWGVLAASLALVFCGGLLLVGKFSTVTVSVGGINRVYRRDAACYSGTELGYVWPWEYQTTPERFSLVAFGGNTYQIRQIREQGISTDLIGEKLATCVATGWDSITDTEYTREVDVYRIRGIDEAQMVAVDLDGAFYVYNTREYAPPADFGAVLEAYSLPQHLELRRFTVYEEGSDRGHYALAEDGVIWEILESCREGTLIQEEQWSRNEGNYLSFTATSEALGIYKRVFYVTADGYIWTNILDFGYLFDIGQEAAGKIISYAMENAAEAEPEPYMESLAGTVTEIGADYFLVDDSVLCPRQEEGMTFRVPTSDLRIRRYIEMGIIGEGDLVKVEFLGSIDPGAGNTVQGVQTVSKAILTEAGAAVPE